MTDEKKKNLRMYGHKHVYKYTEKVLQEST